MNSISPNLNLMIKACEKASKILIRDFGELENLQVSKKGPKDFVTNSDKKTEKVLIDELTKNKKKYSGYKILGNDKKLKLIKKKCKNALIGIGQIHNYKKRLKLFNLLKKEGFNLPTIISKYAPASPAVL